MLVNIIQNTISSFISAGVAASGVITTNLKMWLGFETSETLGRELAPSSLSIVTDGGNGTITQISENSYNSSSDGTSGVIRPKFDFNTENGKKYKLVITPTGVITGTVHFDFYDGSTYLFQDYDFTETKEIDFTDNIGVFGAFNGSQVYNITGFTISVKELTQITPDKSGNNNVGELFTGKALYFDGTTFYLDVSGFSMSGNNATFSFWANIEDIIKGDYFFDFHSSTTRFILGFGQTSQKLAVYSGGWHDFGDPPQDQWVRIVLTVKGTIAKCFVNGVQLGTDKTISTYDFSSATTTHIGARYTPETIPKYYEGLLSDFQVYDKVWLNDDIAYDYANPQNLVTDRDNTTIALSNLKAYWAMSEGAGSLTYDSSGEGNNGTIYGATYEPAQPRIPQLGMMDWAKSTPVSDEVTLIPNPNNTSQDIFGNAVRDRLNSFNLDGIGYAEVADDADLDFGTGAFTMECWVKADFENTGSQFNIIFILGGEYANTDTASIWVNSTTLNAKIGSKVLNADSNYIIGDWYHVCVTRDGSNLCTLYIDAEAQADTETTSASITNTSNKLIGRDALTTRFYKNLISDVRLYKGKGLSAEEVENNYNAGLSAHTN